MVTHFDAVEPVPSEGGTRWPLGPAAGTTRVGVSRYRLPAGERVLPVHDEELCFVLGGEGLSGGTSAVRAGDCLLQLAGGATPALAGAGAGLDVLVFGGGWVPEPEARPPATIVHLDDIEADPWGRGDVNVVRRDIGEALGSRTTGMQHLTVAPGALSSPPHCHSAEEEVFVVLDGDGTLLLGDEEHPVRAGSVVGRPPGTGVAHAFRAGEHRLTLLAYGTREPNDICFYPRSGKVSLRGIRAMFRVEQVGYWDGEA